MDNGGVEAEYLVRNQNGGGEKPKLKPRRIKGAPPTVPPVGWDIQHRPVTSYGMGLFGVDAPVWRPDNEGGGVHWEQRLFNFGGSQYASFSKSDLKIVKDSLRFAQELTNNKECDEALKADGVPSLAALLKDLNPSGPGANVFDGRSSTLAITDKGKPTTVAQYAKDNRESVGAFVPDSTGPAGGKVTFLNDRFFNPKFTAWIGHQRAIILLHEAVHQIAGKSDADFKGSKALSEKIIQGCYPILKGKLGGVG
jgi:hypothetical protein